MSSRKETCRNFPPELATAVKKSLRSAIPEIVQAAVLAAKGEGFDDLLLVAAREERNFPETRLVAFAAAASHKQPLADTDVLWLKHLVTQGESPLARITAARGLGSAALTSEQLRGLTTVIEQIGPLELLPLLGVFTNTTDDAVAKELITALAKSPAPVLSPSRKSKHCLNRFPKTPANPFSRSSTGSSPPPKSSGHDWKACSPISIAATRRPAATSSSTSGPPVPLVIGSAITAARSDPT